MTPDRLSRIIFASVTKSDLSPALRAKLTVRALQQFYQRIPLCGVFVCVGTVAMPRCLLISRN